MDSATAIARVVSDLRRGRYETLLTAGLAAQAHEYLRGPVVDSTGIYRSLVDRVSGGVAVYEDHPCISPPWETATICYANEHGNVVAMVTSAADARVDGPFGPGELVDFDGDYQPRYWKTAEPLDWDRVRWVLHTWVYIGGRSDTLPGPLPTRGPVHAWQFAIAENGEPLDLHWIHLVPAYPLEHWDMAHLVLLGTLNFANCRNIEIVEPKRERHEQRRLDRAGVRVSTIQIRPFGRTSRGAKGEPLGLTPLTSVRGHFACYGPDYGRGLLFGKLAGRYWISQHARGNAEEGVSVADYQLVPDGSER